MALNLADPPALPDPGQEHHTLGRISAARYHASGDLADLGAALQHLQTAVDLTPDGHPERAARLGALAAASVDRFRRLEDLKDLELGMQMAREAVTLDPVAAHLQTLAILHSERFRRLGQLEDLHAGLERQQEAVNLTPDERLKSLDPFAPMIFTFNAEKTEIESISGGVGAAGSSGIIGGVGGQGEGPILNFAANVRWKRVSGGTGGAGGAGTEHGGAGGKGMAPVINIAHLIPPDTTVDDANVHQRSDKFDIKSLEVDEDTGTVTIDKSTGMFQWEPSSEFATPPADMMLRSTTHGGRGFGFGRGWTRWWLGVNVGLFVVAGGLGWLLYIFTTGRDSSFVAGLPF
ncbi:hypothetical protein B0H19DRAFT_1123190 [Mycena capillaripes]|nr:hypothetical protein B0H19DRAFT_1123190 [Mycena capillaripes]